MKLAVFGVAIGLGLISLQMGCATASVGERSVKKIFPKTLRVRRPPGPGADPSVGPGGIDYKSKPLPDEKFDCEKIDSFIQKLDLKSIRTCLLTLRDPYTALYRLRREPTPYLELRDAEKAPACLREKLPKLPVPREILYQSNVEGSLNCYSTRLDLEADEILHTKLPIEKLALRLDLPLLMAPRDDNDMVTLLTTWVLAPLWNSEDKNFAAKLVPDSICRKCLGEREMMFKIDPEVPTPMWP